MNIQLQFFAQNAHFAINLLAALVILMIAWLHFDAWTTRKDYIGIWKWLGFLLLAVSFAIHSIAVEQEFIADSIFGDKTVLIGLVVRLISFVIIIYSQIIDPLQQVPDSKGLSLEKSNVLPVALIVGTGLAGLLQTLLPVGALVITGLFWRRSEAGLERHLRPVAWGFMFLTYAELISLASFWRDSSSVALFNFTRAFGAAWIIEHVLFVVGITILGIWVGWYLIRRLQSQLFLIFNTAVTLIFLLITTTFTFLLMQNVVTESLDNLSVANKVLDYALTSKQAETQANLETVIQNPLIQSATASGNRNELIALTDTFLANKKQSSLIITNADGQVLLRAEEPDRFGDSISEDTGIKRAAVGVTGSTIQVKEAVAVPLVQIRSIGAIKNNGTIVGTASVGLVIGDEFVDGVKQATGLDSTVYAGKVRSATTLLAPDGKSRLVGIKQADNEINTKVLSQGKEFRGSVNIQSAPYLAVFSPLKDIDNEVVGMLFAGKPQVAVLQTAGRSIELSFLIAVVLLIISVVPTYLISRAISRQLEG